MQVILDPKKFTHSAQPSIVTVGVFDGVHLGHQAILRVAKDWAAAEKAITAVITFRRHPDSLLKGQAPPAITSLEHRLVLLQRLHIDLCIVLSFDDETRHLSAEEFSRLWFVEKLQAQGVVLGPDNAIGHNREGTPQRLAVIGKEYGFSVKTAPPVKVNGKWISSTAIRQAIRTANFDQAEQMLGRRPSIYGSVVHGDARGASLGFPTANLNTHHELLPENGVYFAWLEHKGVTIFCLINIGKRPTFKSGEAQETMEAFLLDFDGDLYGENLELILGEKIREEKKFASVEELKKQIRMDVMRARELKMRTS